jgi:hypothetical protein
MTTKMGPADLQQKSEKQMKKRGKGLMSSEKSCFRKKVFVVDFLTKKGRRRE